MGTVGLGAAVSVLTMFVLGMAYPNLSFSLFGSTLPVAIVLCGIVPLTIFTFVLLSIRIGSSMGERTNTDLVHFLKRALTIG